MKSLSEKHVLPTKILILPKKETEKATTSGIIIPEIANKVTSLGQAVICGTGTTSVPMPISVTDWIMYSPHAAIKVRYDDIDYALIGVQDVLLFWKDSQ